jgi:hypothetical protein
MPDEIKKVHTVFATTLQLKITVLELDNSGSQGDVVELTGRKKDNSFVHICQSDNSSAGFVNVESAV